MSRWLKVSAAVALCVGMLACSVRAGEAKAPPSLDELAKQLAAWKHGQSRQPKVDMAARIRASYNDAGKRKELVGRLVALIEANDATPECKWFCCEQLSIVADDSVVPVLAKLLPDPKMSHRARIGLERIPGPKAGKALRDFLATAKGKLLIGAINSIGERRDADAVADLVKLLGHADPAVVGAAAIALGKIGGSPATAALGKAKDKAEPNKLRPIVVGAYLRCGDHLVAAGKGAQAWPIYHEMYAAKEPKAIRIAALRGLVNADRAKALPLVAAALTGDDPLMQAVATEFVRETKDPAETKAYVALLARMKPEAQARLLGALADRGDRTARDAVAAAAQGQDATVRAAALAALAALGDASTVPLLAKVAATGPSPDNGLAAASLGRLSAPGVDEAILKAMAGAEAKIQVALIRSLGVRRHRPAVPALLALAKGKEASVRPEAIRAAGILAEAKHLAALIDLLVHAPGGGEQRAAEEAVRALCARSRDVNTGVAQLLAAMPKANVSARCALLRVAGRLGGTKALEATRAALKDKDAKIQDTALRALVGWPDPSAANDLMALVKTSEQLSKKVLAFRGFCRMAGLRARQSPGDGLKMYEQAMKAAPRPEEKKLVIGGIGNVRHPAALKAALQYLADPALQAEAAAAVKKIASDRNIRRRHRKEAEAALKQVQQATKKKK